MTSNVKSLVYKMNIVVDCKDAGVLAEFYSKLLGWELTHQRANGWAAITSPSGMVMAFQEIEEYQPPALGDRIRLAAPEGGAAHLPLGRSGFLCGKSGGGCGLCHSVGSTAGG